MKVNMRVEDYMTQGELMVYHQCGVSQVAGALLPFVRLKVDDVVAAFDAIAETDEEGRVACWVTETHGRATILLQVLNRLMDMSVVDGQMHLTTNPAAHQAWEAKQIHTEEGE